MSVHYPVAKYPGRKPLYQLDLYLCTLFAFASSAESGTQKSLNRSGETMLFSRTKTTFACALIGLAGTTGAQASVIYDWQPMGASGVVVDSGQLIFSDNAYRSGSAVFDGESRFDDPLTTNIYPDSPIIETSLTFQAVEEGVYESLVATLTVRPREGMSGNDPIYDLSSSFSFADDLLTGEYSALTSESQYAMSSNADGVWTVDDVNSDRFPCDGFCGTATGRWVLNESSLDRDVPAPSVWGLFGLAGLAMFGAARRRHRA